MLCFGVIFSNLMRPVVLSHPSVLTFSLIMPNRLRHCTGFDKKLNWSLGELLDGHEFLFMIETRLRRRFKFRSASQPDVWKAKNHHAKMTFVNFKISSRNVPVAYILTKNGLADSLLNNTQALWCFGQGHIHGELLRRTWENNWKYWRKWCTTVQICPHPQI